MRQIPFVVVLIFGVIMVFSPTPTHAQSGTWQAEFYNNVDASSMPVYTINVGDVNFNWGDGSPGPGVNSDNFSVRFTGNLYFDGGDYQITVTTDDEFSLYVNGVQQLSTWNTNAQYVSRPVSTTMSVRPGYNLVQIYFREFVGGASIRTSWIRINANPPVNRPPANTYPPGYYSP